MRKSENLCNLDESNTISASTRNKVGSNTIKNLNSSSDIEESTRSTQDTNNNHNSNNNNEHRIRDDSSLVDIILAHELARALRAQDTDAFFEIYDSRIPTYFDRQRVSSTQWVFSIISFRLEDLEFKLS